MKINCIFLVVSLIGLLVGCGVSDEDQIRSVMQGSLQAYAAEDIDNVMSYMPENCERIMTYADGETVTGKDEVKASYAGDFARADDIEATGEITSVKVSGDTATAVQSWQMEFTDLQADGARVVATGKSTASLRKIDGIWKIAGSEDSIDTWEKQE